MAIALTYSGSQRARTNQNRYLRLTRTVERGKENGGRKTLDEYLRRTAERIRAPEEAQVAMQFPLLAWSQDVPLGKPGK
jgi:hypothetical protein